MMKRKDEYYNQAFAKHTPTAFIIESPFQLLCAWEAIEEFEIQDFRIVLVLERNNIRNEQTISMLNEKGIEYEVCYNNEIYAFLKQEHPYRYDRVMVGDYDDLGLLKVCGAYATNNAVVVFMDDGISSIMILKDHPYKHSKFVRMLTGPTGMERARKQIFKKWKQIGIINNHYIYSIYSEIKTKKFQVYPNTFSHLAEYKSKEQKDVVLIVGTVIDDTAAEIGIPTSLFEGLLWDKLVSVKKKYPTERLIYIPHGRDYNEHIEQLCQCLDIEFIRLKMSIEYYVIKDGLHVLAVYGNTSTALSALRIITSAPVTHWLIPNMYGEAWRLTKLYTKYYEQMGIQTDEWWMPQISFWEYVKRTVAKYLFRKKA